VTAQRIIAGLQDAFEAQRAKAVTLRIDSADGSLVQAREIRTEILRLRSTSDKPIYVVVAEQCQATTYLLASATDRIYANKASRVGSLALRMAGFGLHEAIERLGIERRSRTAGAHKAIRDPFRPQSEEEREILQRLLYGL